MWLSTRQIVLSLEVKTGCIFSFLFVQLGIFFRYILLVLFKDVMMRLSFWQTQSKSTVLHNVVPENEEDFESNMGKEEEDFKYGIVSYQIVPEIHDDFCHWPHCLQWSNLWIRVSTMKQLTIYCPTSYSYELY